MKSQLNNTTLFDFVDEGDTLTLIKKPLVLNEVESDVKNGYGACKLCDCAGYESRNDGSHVCKVCRHHKSQHHS